MNSNYVFPITIVVAGALIAGAVLFLGKSSVPTGNGDSTNVTARPYDPAVDHILGNPEAPVKVVEYMDLECPHCKDFHTTMHRIIDFYSAQRPGQVAWVERAFPLASIHSKAPQEAEAAECAADQKGNEGYWKFVDRLFEVTPGNNGQIIGADGHFHFTGLCSGGYKVKVQFLGFKTVTIDIELLAQLERSIVMEPETEPLLCPKPISEAYGSACLIKNSRFGLR